MEIDRGQLLDEVLDIIAERDESTPPAYPRSALEPPIDMPRLPTENASWDLSESPS